MAAAVVTMLHSVAGISCGQCATLQEGIHRSILANISTMESANIVGSRESKTLEIGQIIWSLCRHDSWKDQRYASPIHDACRETVEPQGLPLDALVNLWKEKTVEEYKDGAIVLQMKRAACSHADLGVPCAPERLPSDYEPLRPEECAVCRAMVSDLYGLVHTSRDRPKGAKADAYYRLVGKLADVCLELPSRHALRRADREAVRDVCEDLWDEHEAAFARLAVDRSMGYAQSLCADNLELCDEASSQSDLLGVHEEDEPIGKEEL